jgi:cation diffusion facilitator CzcD-associated flavoprotein CzcO
MTHSPLPTASQEHFDVIVVGAGISGIGAGYHLQANCPDRTYVILEGRERIGGTWDLFRYPGIRSDSDMYTLGYSFKPWTNAKAIADGPSILAYLNETARENGIDRHIRFGYKVKSASWSSATARWTVETHRAGGDVVRLTCNFLHMCSGYYSYEAGYTPDFPGTERFTGRVVHPQKWTDDIDYAGKRVVIIGSGATAVTLVPEMAKQAAHVVMLQRSPSYVVSRPAVDRIANALRAILPARIAYGLTRWKNVLLVTFFYQLSRRRPRQVKRALLDAVRKELGPNYDVAKHFKPRYNPWDQRVCLVPDGDLFAAIREGRASVVTDEIETFTEKGLRLRSGAELEADLIVTATGLELVPLANLSITVDGVPIRIADTVTYKGMMLSGVPNMASSVGYTNASWTLKCDLTCEYVCRLLNHMREHGYAICTPQLRDPSVQAESWIDFSSGYVQRSLHKFPKQGSKSPWRLHQNYLLDTISLGYGRVDDGTMEFAALPEPAATPHGAPAEPVGATG